MPSIRKGQNVQNRMGYNGSLKCTHKSIQEKAFLEYFNKEDEEQACLGMNGKMLNGQPLNVEIVRENTGHQEKRHQIRHYNRHQGGHRHYRHD